MKLQIKSIISLGLAVASTVAAAEGHKAAPGTPPLHLSVAAITMANSAVVKVNGQRYVCKQKSGCSFGAVGGTMIVFLPKQ